MYMCEGRRLDRKSNIGRSQTWKIDIRAQLNPNDTGTNEPKLLTRAQLNSNDTNTIEQK